MVSQCYFESGKKWHLEEKPGKMKIKLIIMVLIQYHWWLEETFQASVISVMFFFGSRDWRPCFVFICSGKFNFYQGKFRAFWKMMSVATIPALVGDWYFPNMLASCLNFSVFCCRWLWHKRRSLVVWKIQYKKAYVAIIHLHGTWDKGMFSIT